MPLIATIQKTAILKKTEKSQLIQVGKHDQGPFVMWFPTKLTREKGDTKTLWVPNNEWQFTIIKQSSQFQKGSGYPKLDEKKMTVLEFNEHHFDFTFVFVQPDDKINNKNPNNKQGW